MLPDDFEVLGKDSISNYVDEIFFRDYVAFRDLVSCSNQTRGRASLIFRTVSPVGQDSGGVAIIGIQVLCILNVFQ